VAIFDRQVFKSPCPDIKNRGAQELYAQTQSLAVAVNQKIINCYGFPLVGRNQPFIVIFDPLASLNGNYGYTYEYRPNGIALLEKGL